jgi:hypothetical protein
MSQETKASQDSGIVGEGSRAKTFEHLEIFPISGESENSGGVTRVIESSCRERSKPLDPHID